MKIQNPTANEITQLSDLRLAYLQEDLGFINQEEKEKLKSNLTGYFKDHLNRDLFAYVAKEKGTIVSCALLLIASKPHSPSFPTGKIGTLLNVYTFPEYRKRGYASRLIQEILDDFNNLGLSHLELKATEQGKSLYKKNGFEEENSTYTSMKWKPGD